MPDSSRFHCPACHRRYRFRDDWAGRVIRCLCSARIRAPLQPAEDAPAELVTAPQPGAAEPSPASGPTAEASDVAPDPEPDTAGMEIEEPPSLPGISGQSLADAADGAEANAEATPPAASTTGEGRQCPQCGQKVQPEAVICVNCGFHMQRGEFLQPATGADAGHKSGSGETGGGSAASPVANVLLNRDQENANPLILDLYVPAALVTLGVVLYFVYSTMLIENPDSFVLASIGVVLRVTIYVPLMLLGLWVAAKLLGTAYGELHFAILKLTAIAFAPGMVGNMMSLALGDGLVGWFFGLALEFLVMLGLVKWLFELDMAEMLLTVVILGVVNLWTLFLVGLLLASVFGP